MPNCNINRNEKETCRAGVADNGLIDFELQIPTCNTNMNEKNVPSRCCRQRSHSHSLNFKCPPVISIGMKKKRAEQVLQTTVSLLQFELQMHTCNINRNEKKSCRAGVADNSLINIV